MIQLITTISDEISYYVTEYLTTKLNTLFIEIQRDSSLNLFNTFGINELEKTKIAMINNKIISLCLDYSSIEYAQTLAFALNVPESYIYDVAYRRIVKNENLLFYCIDYSY